MPREWEGQRSGGLGTASGLATESYRNVSRETFLSGWSRKPYKPFYGDRPFGACERAENRSFWRRKGSRFIGLCEGSFTALTKGHHALTLKTSEHKTPAEETSSRVMRKAGAEGATAPETLRPTDRSGMTLWKAIFQKKENPPKEVTLFEKFSRAKEIFQVSGQRGQGAPVFAGGPVLLFCPAEDLDV